MEISTLMIFRLRYSAFSLIEVMSIIGLVSLVMGIGIVQIPNLNKPVLEEFKHLVRVVNALRNEAILGQNIYYLTFDIREQSVWVERLMKDGDRIIIDQPKILRRHTFKASSELKNIFLVATKSIQNDPLKIVSKPVSIQIDSSGFVDPFTLFFVDRDDAQWRVFTKNIMGSLELQEDEENVFKQEFGA